MLLIGAVEILDENRGEELNRFYGQAFSRVQSVENTGEITRYVGYQAALIGSHSLRFLGVEVERVASVPADLVAWELGENLWRVLANPGGEGVTEYEGVLAWVWHSTSEQGRAVGEFRGAYPGVEEMGERTFLLTANSYTSFGRQGASDDIEIVEYDLSWPDQYDAMSEWLRHALGRKTALRIDHFGSTSIPGMPAKPVIDILVRVPSEEDAKPIAIPALNSPEWEYWWYDGHAVFVKRDGFVGKRTHHVHLFPKGEEYARRVAFRDYLRRHPQDAAEYAVLKRELAAAHRDDREAYTQAKREFVERICAKRERAEEPSSW